ncbi:DUF4124 domain-containing protein [Paucibacter sp. TC2R-5]|uniref:DUF4124 domain-containing protein n=1 Tax=Paucibacter sp. TC2R-5 TaxID=2893555 RepID=UPI0021E414C3|nr:DUF4124 domain-containing protein [Paucibacter sp. TC2R-5]MCV2360044.1 DUF4124 domain-containing protein [Paucibacter sp. TC2R-5]
MKITVVTLAVAASSIAAQSLPPPSRTVYKCEEGKNVHYSDSPCLGGKKVDVAPTSGINKSTGQERIGHDVQREKHNELMADALRPIINETPEQRATRHKRFNLVPSAKADCARLDNLIPKLEGQERSAAPQTISTVQRELLAAREKFHNLRC